MTEMSTLLLTEGDEEHMSVDYVLRDIVQRIFSSATRRELLGKHLKGGRRGGELKIDWTKPPD
jgi:hypothetical protein